MISDKFMVNSDAGRMAAARYATENFAWQAKLNKRDTLRLDLLVEETLGMVKAMLEDFYGQLWVVMEGGICEIHVEATSDMNSGKKRELLSVSTSGTNAAAKGFMSRIGEMITGALYNVGQTLDAYGQETIRYGVVHMPVDMSLNTGVVPIWTLQNYRTDLEQARGTDDYAEAALDDLEKSIVARLADDIVVGVKGDRVDLIITKAF